MGKRRVAPSCVVWQIRNHFPTLTGDYIGFRAHLKSFSHCTKSILTETTVSLPESCVRIQVLTIFSNFDPFSWLKLLVVTIAVEGVWMIYMFVCHVPYKRVPFHKNEFAEAWFCRCGTQLQMPLNSLHLVPNDFPTNFLAFCKELLSCWPYHMPYTIIVGCVFACRSYPLCDTFEVVLNKGTNGQAVPEMWNISLLPPVLFDGCPQSHLPDVSLITNNYYDVLIFSGLMHPLY